MLTSYRGSGVAGVAKELEWRGLPSDQVERG